MFKVDTPQGERYMVQLVGPSSYRMGQLMAYRGQTLTVSKRTRDYLVRKTGGAWKDFDPTPAEPVQEILPPQFGEPGGPAIDMEDIDAKANPPMSMEHAMALAAKGKGKEVATNGAIPYIEPEGLDTADLLQAPSGAPEAPDGSGDMTSADLSKATQKPSGGASATNPAKGGVKVMTKATPKPAETAPSGDAVTVD